MIRRTDAPRNAWALLAAFLVLSSSARAGTSTRNEMAGREAVARWTGPYCGLLCVYASMRAGGIEEDMHELMKPEYVGDPKGSSLGELQRAAHDHHMNAVPLARLSSDTLRRCSHWVILRVRSNPGSREYNHYELFLGVEGDKAVIYDPPNPPERISFAELATLWSGEGLVVSASPIDLHAALNSARIRFVFWAGGICVVVLLIRYLLRFVPIRLCHSSQAFLGMSVGQGAALAVMALFFAMIYHFTSETGLLANAQGTQVVQRGHAPNFIPKITARGVREAQNLGTVFIDARQNRDYQAGHLNGAVNIPVDANDVKRGKMVASMPRNSKVVVYCQSSGCQYADNVALWLQEHGFSDIAIYRGGWLDWVNKNGKENTEGRS